MKKLIKGVKIILSLAILFLLLIVLLFGYSDIPLEKLKSKYTNAASLFISVNGMDVHYRNK